MDRGKVSSSAEKDPKIFGGRVRGAGGSWRRFIALRCAVLLLVEVSTTVVSSGGVFVQIDKTVILALLQVLYSHKKTHDTHEIVG